MIVDVEGVNGSLDQPKNVGETRNGKRERQNRCEKEIKEHIFCRVSQHFFDPLLGRNSNDVCTCSEGEKDQTRAKLAY